MDRTLISFNLPNLITIPIMAVLGWFVLGLVWQVVRKTAMPSNQNPSGAGGY
jgi:hypothetical protein